MLPIQFGDRAKGPSFPENEEKGGDGREEGREGGEVKRKERDSNR